MYDHMNNSIYYFLYEHISPTPDRRKKKEKKKKEKLTHLSSFDRFDSVVNTYLMQHCSLHPPSSPLIGLVVHSHCDYFAAVGFPALVDLGLRVKKLGNSSVTYEIGVFERGVNEVKAVGEFVHVFVDRESRRPRADGMSQEMKKGLGKLLGDDSKEKGKAML
jgi:acyl-CoA thioester hydrolase